MMKATITVDWIVNTLIIRLLAIELSIVIATVYWQDKCKIKSQL